MTKYALVTGSSSGVGLVVAKHLCSIGYHVLALARRHTKILDELDQHRHSITPFYADLTDVETTTNLIQSLLKKYKLDVVVNNAGVLIKEDIEKIDRNMAINSFNVNSLSPLLITSLCSAQMKQNNYGRIINITSGAPFNCFPEFALYSATKAYLNAFTITAAKEFEGKNIKINLMSPGPVKSEMSPHAQYEPDICLPTFDYLISPSTDLPSGKLFWLGYEIPIFPDLSDIDWLNAKAGPSLKKVI